ncbi:phytoene/squalene synthase family protein [Novipirellula artificiosorum]|uniref:All-trans-phytoene synthase n=1 Tax=Novipirellula artificiosorum TaxID=2528016 RepID=A0A5C6DZI7_9BACT|nr:phytoene/squalene synthase family protein [Novipirellula artificiosorum]TWU42058.1 All-trans-phytoene synthase [Novipirellula artificiosorum]
MKSEISLAASYRYSRRMTRRSGSNFYRSFWLLPRSKRDAMYALYAFARVTDDVGDCGEPAALRTRWLAWWRHTTALNLISDSPHHQIALPDLPEAKGSQWTKVLPQKANEILPALRDASDRYGIPTRYLLEIIDGVLADQQKTRFDTYEQLEHYCYLVASAVGLACLHIWEFDSPLPLESAVDCGLAFQMTNVLRDVAEDAKRGRIYLPRQHYEQHGLCEDDLLHPRGDDRLRCLIQDEIARSKRLFDSGWNVWDSLHEDGRPMFSMMWRTYRRLLSRIEQDPGAVALRRIKLSAGDRLGLVSQHFFVSRFRRLAVPPTEVSGG